MSEVERKLGELLDLCESPIERDFASGLMVRWLERTEGWFRYWPPKADQYTVLTVGDSDRDETLSLFPQAQVGDMRIDFIVTLGLEEDPKPLVFVECDGHDFHERTKEQARRDRQRDRRLQALGHPVMRFTGSEIWADHHAVADEVIDLLLKMAEG